MRDPLPADGNMDGKTLKSEHDPVKIYYGAVSWGRKEWVGKIYPERTKEKHFLAHYAQNFNAVELKATHYRHYTAKEIKNWVAKAEGKDFLFCPIFPENISRYSNFKDIEDLTDAFFASISGFGKNLGPAFLQLSKKFSPTKKDSLYHYLQHLPDNRKIFLEVQHPAWFEQRTYEDHLKFLISSNIGLVIRDTPDSVLKAGPCTPKTMVRFTPTGDLSLIDRWYDKMVEWTEKGLKELYFFVKPGADPDQQLEALQYFKQRVIS